MLSASCGRSLLNSSKGYGPGRGHGLSRLPPCPGADPLQDHVRAETLPACHARHDVVELYLQLAKCGSHPFLQLRWAYGRMNRLNNSIVAIRRPST